jgi:3-phosphoshikimate 1-carboxyvinyltransferase
MPLPDLIEILPLTTPVRAEITVPGSKSITNRALILAALAGGETTLQGALWSEDTQIMVDCLQKLGFKIEVTQDAEEFCNRAIVVQGLGGKIPNAGTSDKPLELFVGNAGTAARFLSAFVCLGNGVYRIYGIPRMNERPKAALFQALRELGYRVESPTEKLPAVVHGEGLAPTPKGSYRGEFKPSPPSATVYRTHQEASKRRKCTVSIQESSQFASALLLCASVGDWEVKVIGEDAEESAYVAMTSKLIQIFPQKGGSFQIEADASSGSYFLAAQNLLPKLETLEYSAQFGTEVPTVLLHPIRVNNWPNSGWQMDELFAEFLGLGKIISRGSEDFRAAGLVTKQQILDYVKEQMKKPRSDDVSRKSDLGDSIMTAIVIAPLLAKLMDREKGFKFTDLGRLRLQETERVVALRTELTKCGAKVLEEGDTLTVYPSELHGAEIETYDDHRMAMCFAILGLKVPGIKIKNPACVKKTFPNFFQKLAASPPKGLGVTILDARTGMKLSHEDLFAE